MNQGRLWLRSAAPALAALQGVCRHLQGIVIHAPKSLYALSGFDELNTFLQEEEEERSDRWKSFLERRTESPGHGATVSLSVDEAEAVVSVEDNVGTGSSELSHEKSAQGLHSWKPIRSSLGNIEQMMGLRVEKKHSSAVRLQPEESTHLVTVEEAKVSGDSDDEFYDADKVDPSQEVHSGDSVNAEIGNMSQEETYSLKEQLECLVHGGLPMALRGEVLPVSYGFSNYVSNFRFTRLIQQSLAFVMTAVASFCWC